jgi:hypothetical protein
MMALQVKIKYLYDNQNKFCIFSKYTIEEMPEEQIDALIRLISKQN